MSSSLALFVATRAADVPAGVTRYASVDGSVPGASITWDHHVSGEPVSLDALPARISLDDLDGLGTTLADTDAIVGAAVVLRGGLEAVAPERLAILRAASWWCDHLRGAPGVEGELDRLGRGLHEHCAQRLAGVPRSETSPVFAALVRELLDALERSASLPYAATAASSLADLRTLRTGGAPRLVEHGARDRWPVALVDLRGLGEAIEPLHAYAQHRCPVAVTVAAHSKGGTRYTVGVNPHVEPLPDDLRHALARVALAEHAHGPPCRGPEPVPGNENWGGRATVFGSPWNYGSRLSPDEVVRLVREALAA